jgi:hypothetical protein
VPGFARREPRRGLQCRDKKEGLTGEPWVAPRKEPAACAGRRFVQGKESGLSSASQALFVAGSLDDFVAVAEAEVGSEHPLLVPEALDRVL